MNLPRQKHPKRALRGFWRKELLIDTVSFCTIDANEWIQEMIHTSHHDGPCSFVNRPDSGKCPVGADWHFGQLTVDGSEQLCRIPAPRSNSKRELQRIREQINLQKKAERREQFAALKQKYLAPLRYYAQMLGLRFDELKSRFALQEDGRVRNRFKQMKDHVSRDQGI